MLSKILTEQYKKALFEKVSENNIFIKKVKSDFISDMLEIFGVQDKEKTLSDILNTYRMRDISNEFEIIEYVINKFIPSNKLYSNIYRIKHDYLGRYDIFEFVLKTKNEVLRDIDSEWSFNNLKLVNEFLSDDNIVYEQLKKIKEKFVIYDW